MDRNRKVAVIGVGISNRPLIRYISSLGRHVTAFDRMSEDNPKLIAIQAGFQEEGVHLDWRTGTDYLSDLKRFDLIFRTPLLQPYAPELVQARQEVRRLRLRWKFLWRFVRRRSTV